MYSIALKSAVAVVACIGLIGCAGGGSLTPTATADIQQALAAGCPILAAIQASGLPLNKYQKSAIATLASVCPPNPPPTTALVAVGDIVAAYTALKPLLKH